MTGLELKNWRKEAKLTQEQVGKLLKVSRKTANTYESKEDLPNLSDKLLHFLLENSKQSIISEPNNKYGLASQELKGDIVEDLREKIYILQNTLKDKEEIIILLKEKLKNK